MLCFVDSSTKRIKLAMDPQISVFLLSPRTIKLISFIAALAIATLLYLAREAAFTALGIMLIMFGVLSLCIVLPLIAALVHSTIWIVFSWPLYRESETDLEAGESSYPSSIISGNSNESSSDSASVPLSQSQFRIDITLLQILMMELLDRLREHVDEGGDEELIELERLPPPVSYKSNEQRSNCIDCAICLEDFAEDESCRVFLACKHMFHTECVDHWLRNRQTCPICRKPVMNS